MTKFRKQDSIEHRIRREATYKEEEVKKGSKTDIDYKMKEKMSTGEYTFMRRFWGKYM